jgi:hypothetical protein
MNPFAIDDTLKCYKFFSDILDTDDRDSGNVTKRDVDMTKPIVLAMDFNRFPQTAVLCQKQGKHYIAFDEVRTDNATTHEQALNVVQRLVSRGIGHVWLYGDNTSNQGDGRFGKNDWQIVKEALTAGKIRFTSKLKKQNPKRKPRVDLVNNLIMNVATAERRMFIHERCKFLIRDYNESIVDDNGIKKDSGEIGHISDAFDYFMYWSEKSPTTRWNR